MDEGWGYGEWETGPWWFFHTKVCFFPSLLFHFFLFHKKLYPFSFFLYHMIFWELPFLTPSASGEGCWIIWMAWARDRYAGSTGWNIFRTIVEPHGVWNRFVYGKVHSGMFLGIFILCIWPDLCMKLTWRHTCVVADFIEGRTMLFENGVKYFDKTGITDMQETYKKNKKTIDMVSVG